METLKHNCNLCLYFNLLQYGGTFFTVCTWLVILGLRRSQVGAEWIMAHLLLRTPTFMPEGVAWPLTFSIILLAAGSKWLPNVKTTAGLKKYGPTLHKTYKVCSRRSSLLGSKIEHLLLAGDASLRVIRFQELLQICDAAFKNLKSKIHYFCFN